jgi:hypothetical protein
MNNSRVARVSGLWFALSLGQALLVFVVAFALDELQSLLKVETSGVVLLAARLLASAHAALTWPLRLLAHSSLPDPVLATAAAVHFALWGAAWLLIIVSGSRISGRRHEG